MIAIAMVEMKPIEEILEMKFIIFNEVHFNRYYFRLDEMDDYYFGIEE